MVFRPDLDGEGGKDHEDGKGFPGEERAGVEGKEEELGVAEPCEGEGGEAGGKDCAEAEREGGEEGKDRDEGQQPRLPLWEVGDEVAVAQAGDGCEPDIDEASSFAVHVGAGKCNSR